MSKASRKRRCVFCGGTPVSAEHVWPRWLRASEEGAKFYAQHQGADTDAPHFVMSSSVTMDAEGVPVVALTPVHRGRRVSPMSLTVSVPCRQCNNGWMGVLESRAKPVLERLMAAGSSGEEVIEGEDLATLRRWAVKTAAMFEFNDPGTRTMGPDVYAALRDGADSLPGVWRIGMYRSEDPLNHFRLSHTGGSYRGARRGVAVMTDELGKASITLMGVHRVVLLVTHATGPWAEPLTRLPAELPVPADLFSEALCWPAPEIDGDQWAALMVRPPVGPAPGLSAGGI